MSKQTARDRLAEAAFAQAPKKSIDYAVMERTDLAAVLSSKPIGLGVARCPVRNPANTARPDSRP